MKTAIFLGLICVFLVAESKNIDRPDGSSDESAAATIFDENSPDVILTGTDNKPHLEIFTPNEQPRAKASQQLNRHIYYQSAPSYCEAQPDTMYELQSPNYPDSYTGNDQVTYEFIIPSGYGVSISCDQFDLENPYQGYYGLFCKDYVRMCSQFFSYVFCGTMLQGKVLNFGACSSSYQFNFQFISNFFINKPGYHCVLEIFNPNEGTTTQAPVTTQPTSDECQCGVADANRIVGGNTAQEHSIPWQVGLTASGGAQNFCGGTIIDPCYVLTAAHCDPSGAGNYQITVGDHSTTSSADHVNVNVESVTVHPNYNPDTTANDYALVKLATCLDEDPRITDWGMACLPPNTTASYDGNTATVSGWGTTSFGGTQPTQLMEVTQTVLSDAQCASFYGNGYQPSNMLCANGPGDSCQGDSGGPLTTTDSDGREYLIGVVSFGFECDAQINGGDVPGVYSDVSKALDWITSSATDAKCL